MNLITKYFSLKMNVIIMTLLIVCYLFIYENAISRERWGRDFVLTVYYKESNSILIYFQFYEYEFGPRGEHGYLEWADFAYTTDGLHSVRLMRCEVMKQVLNKTSSLILKNKLAQAKIGLPTIIYPIEYRYWKEGDDVQRVEVENSETSVYLTIRWYLPDGVKVKDITVMGEFRVDGLYCSDRIVAERYPIQYSTNSFKSEVITESAQNAPDINQTEQNRVKVYTEPGAVIVKGAEQGEEIKVFTTAGLQVNTTVINSDEYRIQLAANQLYIVNVGEGRYKVVL